MRAQKVAPSEEGAIVTADEIVEQDSTLTSRRVTPREGIYRVPPSEPIGDTRVRAAPYRLLNREIDGWGKGNVLAPQGGRTKNILGRENL